MGLRDKFVKGAVALGALLSAEQVGHHIGHGDAVQERADSDELKSEAIDAEKNSAANIAAEKAKKEEEDEKNFLAGQQTLLIKLRSYNGKVFKDQDFTNVSEEVNDKLQKAAGLDALKNFQVWLRANNDDEVFASTSILKNIISDFDKGNVTLAEAHELIAKNPELKSRIEYVFTAYSKMRNDIVNGIRKDISISNLDTKTEVANSNTAQGRKDTVESMNTTLERIAELLK